MNIRCVVSAGRNKLASDEPAIKAERARIIPRVSIQAAERQRAALDIRFHRRDVLGAGRPAAAVVVAARRC
jgi:hypothetical protein